MTKLAKDEELMRRISDALDAEGGLDADPALRAQLDEDPEALSYAQDLVRIDEVLKGFGAEVREPDWEALASAVEARLDEPLPPLEVDAPPRFLDETDAHVDGRSPVDVSQVDVSQKVPVLADPPAERSAEVVDLGARRARRNAALAWMSGLAAAAAVAIGVSSGAVTFDAAAPEAAPLVEASEDSAAEEALAPPMAADNEADRVAAARAPGRSAPPEPEPAPPAEEAGGGEAAAAAGHAQLAEPEPPALAQDRGRERRRRASREPLAGLDGLGSRTGAPRARRAAPAPVARPLRTQGEASRSSAAAARAALRSAEPAVQRCLTAGADARVALRVDAGGGIVGVEVRPPYGPADQRCIAEALRQVRLAPPPEPYTFRHTFRPAAPSAAPAPAVED